MKPLVFSGPLKKIMDRFVEIKQLSGSDYRSQAMLLLRFDHHLAEKKNRKTVLQKKVIQSYLATLAHLSCRSFSNHYCVLQQFSIYLNQRNPASYVLPAQSTINRSHSRVPYIFSPEQIAYLFTQCQSINLGEECIPSMYRTVFSLLYSTGMRISEVLALDLADYYELENIVHIRKGKFRKERYIVLNPSCADRLNEYLDKYRHFFTPDNASPMFLNIHRRRLGYQSVMRIFKKLLNLAGIAKQGRNGPRIHDFRHTFAVHRLLQWVETDDNLIVKLPFLSTYMGHVSVESTQVYLQATNDLLRAGSSRFRKWFLEHKLEGSMT